MGAGRGCRGRQKKGLGQPLSIADFGGFFKAKNRGVDRVVKAVRKTLTGLVQIPPESMRTSHLMARATRNPRSLLRTPAESP